ncbi:hypothetical protein GLYMA_10G168150v4 [Glycine max]|nr:hypothetical protein GLYMA_10G168150v4 [Glycine max]KAH1138664.1 hypothetical protein GYH30_028241 [Glycine max]
MGHLLLLWWAWEQSSVPLIINYIQRIYINVLQFQTILLL